MTISRQETAENVAFWRRVLNKPEPTAPKSKPTQAERMATWSARNREDEAKAIQTRSAVERTRRDLGTPGGAFEVGAQRYAADGSLWRRTA
ncbi:hypothetical protein [Methylobacterium longum]|uniref:Uncharacterized protein n=1 Tax=Methylobacterium longum TaxID=767694 RepID=A0ABT8ANP6_9HYPH|nr:hypothetical protein [Methylobacterium longum]MDN3571443.1 hypothetical protein [Methylobacterium longum]GJE12579.1 hypothetical protein FOHLNKBM_3629 [Methylobacterium longum]